MIVNVDDHVVDAYSAELHKLYLSIKPLDTNSIKFCALKDIFNSKHLITNLHSLKTFDVTYHLETIIDTETEIYRKLLIKSCDVDSQKLLVDIKTKNHPRLSLYRGFMKFMESDLHKTSKAESLSRKKYKKLISQIAFEMIKVCN